MPSSYYGYTGTMGVGANGSAALTQTQVADPNAAGMQPGCGCQENCIRVHGWLGADYLLWFPPAQRLPLNLVTTAPGAAAPASLLGGHVFYTASSGLRINTGIWLDSCERTGAVAQVDNAFRTYGIVNIAPGNVVNTNVNGQPVAFVLDGNGLNYSSWTQFTNADADTFLRVHSSDTTKWYVLAGTKGAYIEEDLALTYGTGGVTFNEDFHTRSTFFGGEVGFAVRHMAGRLGVDVIGRVGLGAMFNEISILGSNNGGRTSQIFSNDANIGYRENNYFSVAPELTGNVYYQLTERIMVRAGYSFMAYTQMFRPGSYINQNNSAGPGLNGFPNTQPAFTFQQSVFIIHGMNFGAVFKY